jgi:hypothetical protein
MGTSKTGILGCGNIEKSGELNFKISYCWEQQNTLKPIVENYKNTSISIGKAVEKIPHYWLYNINLT